MVNRASAAILCLAAAFPGYAQPLPERAPPADAAALGKLLGFHHAATVLKDECREKLPASSLSAFDAWQSRNRQLVAKVDAYGSNVNWFGASGSKQQFWEDMKKRDVRRVRDQIRAILNDDPVVACRRLAEQYSNGSFDLSRFPDDLAALGIRLPSDPTK